jgi:high-affinity nickel permease
VKNILNWVDFISILPYYIGLIFPGGIAHIFVVLRVLRVVRVLRLARHSDGIKIIFLALSTSVSELFFLIFFWSIAIIFFGSLIHYTEGTKNDNFDSIPRSAWWVVVTMSSVGYGDCYPITWKGKVIGSLCIMSCMLVLALPMTVIISKVTRTYHAYIQRENRIELRRQMVSSKQTESSNNNDSTAV